MKEPLAEFLERLGEGDADSFGALTSFIEWVQTSQGFSLYPAQEEALTGLAMESHVVLSTPTGTGKSLVAAGAHFLALQRGERTVYTAPIKALVSEKFFDLVELFGAANVGMITGDSAINSEAPIICCTAEILANLSLRDPQADNITQVVMDEFHYYAEPDRGWAWQVPLLLMQDAQFLLMSATLGDMSELAADLRERSGRDVELVTGVDRPVPLEFSYAVTPVHETVEKLQADAKTPIYLVHFNQAQAVERAQAISSLKLISKEQRNEIAAVIGNFTFAKGFGQILSRYVRAGIGVHHAGMLPKYRRLIEQLAQRGLLRVICGTDTLGVGINVPIRTVVLTALTKFDGSKMRRLSAREFHQIAGRAGRAGFDSRGDVVIEAPEHEIENLKAELKAADKPGKRKKVAKKQAPAGFVTWNEGTMERLITSEPEPLVSRMRVTHSMVLSVISRNETRENQAIGVMRRLIFDSHEPAQNKFAHARRAIEIFRTLRRSQIVEVDSSTGNRLLRLTVDLQENFALNQPLSPFAIASIELLDPESEQYALDVISIIEATLEDPRVILRAQEHRARGEAIGTMKADGIEYEERMELLEEVTYPKPLEELLEAAYESYVHDVPWARDFQISPKTVVRDMIERAFSFRDLVNFYDLGRAEGVVLRYLSDAYRALNQTVPASAKTEELSAYIDWLGELARQVDSSLLDEWEALSHPEQLIEEHQHTGTGAKADGQISAPQSVRPLTHNTNAFRVMVQNAVFQRVQAAAHEQYSRLADLDSAHGFTRRRWEQALDTYYDEYDSLGFGAEARNPTLLTVDREDSRKWVFRQTFDDPSNDHDWGITGYVDLDASDEDGEAVIIVQHVGPFGEA